MLFSCLFGAGFDGKLAALFCRYFPFVLIVCLVFAGFHNRSYWKSKLAKPKRAIFFILGSVVSTVKFLVFAVYLITALYFRVDTLAFSLRGIVLGGLGLLLEYLVICIFLVFTVCELFWEDHISSSTHPVKWFGIQLGVAAIAVIFISSYTLLRYPQTLDLLFSNLLFWR